MARGRQTSQGAPGRGLFFNSRLGPCREIEKAIEPLGVPAHALNGLAVVHYRNPYGSLGFYLIFLPLDSRWRGLPTEKGLRKQNRPQGIHAQPFMVNEL